MYKINHSCLLLKGKNSSVITSKQRTCAAAEVYMKLKVAHMFRNR